MCPNERLVDGQVEQRLSSGGGSGKIVSSEQRVNSLRSMPRYLNDSEIEEIYKEIDAIKADRSVFDSGLSMKTAYHYLIDRVSVGEDVYPDLYPLRYGSR